MVRALYEHRSVGGVHERHGLAEEERKVSPRRHPAAAHRHKAGHVAWRRCAEVHWPRHGEQRELVITRLLAFEGPGFDLRPQLLEACLDPPA